ncbi:alpha/beta hydrolase [Mesorhizobium escarrei]|uniref:Serine protease, subtilase family n=1 Tax=Mesorhizobium escarrei TaxID=666018 RepID=A0ABM9E117_9HYPH|nr:alpha/beta hydrolase [Mesorhizobium escarrei]CAH2402759.1 Serine protease, subtilase family [Mesorhizobium escarrei]
MAHVTFIHGVGNKPDVTTLHDIWLRNLAEGPEGLDLELRGVTSSMVYWADVLYNEPDLNVAAYESASVSPIEETFANASTGVPTTESAEEAAFLVGVAAKIGGTLAATEAVAAIAPESTHEGAAYERVPLPWLVKKIFLETFLRDVHHYLFNTQHSPRPGTTYRIQNEIRQRFVAALQAPINNGPHIVVSHSMGTVIAYDCLKRIDDCARVNGLVTIGSPLGLDEIQDKLQPGWTRADGFPSKKVSGSWLNVFDKLDPVCGFDPFLANDFRATGLAKLEDIEVSNEGAWRHSIVKYLRAPSFQKSLKEMLSL